MKDKIACHITSSIWVFFIRPFVPLRDFDLNTVCSRPTLSNFVLCLSFSRLSPTGASAHDLSASASGSGASAYQDLSSSPPSGAGTSSPSGAALSSSGGAASAAAAGGSSSHEGPGTPSRRSRLADKTSSLLSQLRPARWVKSSGLFLLLNEKWINAIAYRNSHIYLIYSLKYFQSLACAECGTSRAC